MVFLRGPQLIAHASHRTCRAIRGVFMPCMGFVTGGGAHHNIEYNSGVSTRPPAVRRHWILILDGAFGKARTPNRRQETEKNVSCNPPSFSAAYICSQRLKGEKSKIPLQLLPRSTTYRRTHYVPSTASMAPVRRPPRSSNVRFPSRLRGMCFKCLHYRDPDLWSCRLHLLAERC